MREPHCGLKLAALRARDFDGLVAVLDPDLAVHADQPGAAGPLTEVRGAQDWAKQAILFAKGAKLSLRMRSSSTGRWALFWPRTDG